MSLVKYNSMMNDFAPTSFNQLIDRFFNDSMSRAGGATTHNFVPRVDVFEDEKAFEVHVSVPGMNKEDFKIDINENHLTVSGERKYTKEKKENNFRSVETQYGSFSRVFTLPDNVDMTKIEAEYKNGILEIVLPKDEKKILKTNIKVK